MSDEGFVQIAPDSTGALIRNLLVDVVQPDQTTETVRMQVVSISDEDGNVLNLDQADLLDALHDIVGINSDIRDDLAAIRLLLQSSLS